MTIIPEMAKLPKIEITVPVYQISEPYEVNKKTGSKTYYYQFCYQGSDVNVEGKHSKYTIGAVVSPTSGGSFVRFETQLLGQERIEFFLTPDDLFYAIAKSAGIDLESIEAEAQKIVDKKDEEWILDHPEGEKESEDEIESQNHEDENDYEEYEDEIVDDRPVIYPPDFSKTESYKSGGYLKDIPEPHIWYFKDAPNPRKRKVRVHIMRYYGQGPHYFVGMEQESDFIWDGRENTFRDEPEGWRRLWDAGKGLDGWTFTEGIDPDKDPDEYNKYSIHREFNSYHEARVVIDNVMKKFFPNHEIDWDDYCEQFEPKYEGD